MRQAAETSGWRTEYWVSDPALDEIGFSRYWNDEEKEKQKQWYILDGDFSKMEAYLSQTGLPGDIERAARVLQTKFNRRPSGVGLDMAAGNLWAASYLFKMGPIETLYCLEYSKHRLLTIGPRVLEHYNIPKERIVLALGSFYDVHLADESLDFVFMSQAFHHADDPERLLTEVYRVVKPDGFVVIIGEHIVERSYAKYIAGSLFSRAAPAAVQRLLLGRVVAPRPLLPAGPSKPPPDPIMGDHYYTGREYQQMFSKQFTTRRFRTRRSPSQSFILIKNREIESA